jgi:hypothetical protein
VSLSLEAFGLRMNQPDDFRRRQRANLIAMGIVLALVAATVILLVSLHHGIRREECFAAGHHTCAPVEEQK